MDGTGAAPAAPVTEPPETGIGAADAVITSDGRVLTNHWRHGTTAECLPRGTIAAGAAGAIAPASFRFPAATALAAVDPIGSPERCSQSFPGVRAGTGPTPPEVLLNGGWR